MRIALVAGLIYFLLVFAVGFLLGTLRVLWLVPTLGERYAELLEAPLMLFVIYLSAHYLLRKKYTALKPGQSLLMGAVALGLLLLVEFSLVLGLRGLNLEQYLQSRDPIAGLVYVLSLLIFWFMPRLLLFIDSPERGSGV